MPKSQGRGKTCINEDSHDQRFEVQIDELDVFIETFQHGRSHLVEIL